MKIICLSGKKSAGKDTIAAFIKKYFHEKIVPPYHKMMGHELKMEVAAFADLLKKFCIETLGLTEQQCYGTDDDKNSPTEYKWVDTPAFQNMDLRVKLEKNMTAREVMQVFGTDCVRAWFGNIWGDATLRGIISRRPDLAVITDNRFPSEVETILGNSQGYVIRLTRSPFEDQHESETALDGFNWDRPRCYVVDNSCMTIAEQNSAVSNILDNIFHEEV